MKTFKYTLTALYIVTVILMSAGSASAQTEAQKQQFNQVKQEYHALKLAYIVDEQCNLLNSVSRQNAYSKAFELSHSLRQFGISFDQLEAFETGVEQQLEGKTCAEYAGSSDVKVAKSIADLTAGMNIFIWQAYFEKYPSGVPWRDDCGGGYSNSLIKDGVAEQKHLVSIFKSSPNFAGISANIDTFIQNIHQVCQMDGAFFKMTYSGNSLFKIVKHTIEVHNNMKSGEQRGFIEETHGAQRWKAFRGTTARAQFDSDVPWVVLREAREKNVSGSSIRSTFAENSSVNYGLTSNRQLVFSLRPPSMAEFDTTIFNTVVLTNKSTGQTWRLKKTDRYFKGYSAEVMAASDIKPGDPPHTVQFIMAKTDTESVLKAIGSDQDIMIHVERMEKRTPRLVEVEIIKRESFEGAVTYAFAPKISFSGS